MATPDTSSSLPLIPPNAIPIPIPENNHVTCTRGKHGFHIPHCRLNLSATSHISPILSSYKRALLDPLCHSAMQDAFDALLQNNTWTLVPKPSGANVVWQMGLSS
jgi:hypothetical protein